MLDFIREDEILKEQVGVDAAQILAAAEGSWGDRFYLARERMAELVAEGAASPEISIERDRLASFFGCAYGRDGLLARAGVSLALRDRLGRIEVLTPRLVADPAGMARLRRDAVVARTLARSRLSRFPDGSAARALLEAAHGATSAAIACADFVAAAAAIAGDQGQLFTAGRLWALADLGYVAADTSPQKPLLLVGAYLLSRWAHAKDARTSEGPYDAVIEAHLAGLRDAFWQALEAQLSQGGAPVALTALEQADHELETILARLSDRTVASDERARFLAQLFAIAASGRAGEARRRAEETLADVLRVVAEGLAAETREATP